MKKISFIFLLLAAILSCTNQETKNTKENWIQLFNGKDLNGWTIKFSGYPLNENFKNTFRVENGILKVSYDNYDRFNGEFGHLFYNRKFSKYKLRAEYRFIGQQVPGGPPWGFKNNGLMIHSQSAESMGINQDFPVSIECQLLGGTDSLPQSTANVCTPGTNVVINGKLITQHCTNSTSPSFNGKEWVTVEVVVWGDSIVHYLVNGDTVMTYTHPQIGGGMLPEGFLLKDGTPLKEGYIAIQAETAPTEFRKIELLDLSRKQSH